MESPPEIAHKGNVQSVAKSEDARHKLRGPRLPSKGISNVPVLHRLTSLLRSGRRVYYGLNVWVHPQIHLLKP